MEQKTGFVGVANYIGLLALVAFTCVLGLVFISRRKFKQNQFESVGSKQEL